MPFYRSDQALINVEVAGVTIDKEPWSVFDGGDNVAEKAQFYPGGMKPLVAGGGFPKRTDITVERPWADALINAYKALDGQTGLASVVCSYQVLNANKEPFGAPISYTGILNSVSRPNYKAGQSEEARLKLVIEPNGEVS